MVDSAAQSAHDEDFLMPSTSQSSVRGGAATNSPASSTNSVPTTNQVEEELMLGIKRGLKSEGWSHCKSQKIDDHYASRPRRKRRDRRQRLSESQVEVSGQASLANCVHDQELARLSMTTMIFMYVYPMEIEQHFHFHFHKFLSVVQPLFKPVSMTTTRADIINIYEYERLKTMKLLDQNKSRFAITTDMWTSNNEKKGFMAITVHYIDDEWIIRSRIIRFVYVPFPYNTETLCETLVNCLKDWNLDNGLSTLTLDNCSTDVSLVNLVVNKLSSSNLWMDEKLMHMHCCARILNLIVKDGLDVISDAIENVRDSVAFWVATPKRIKKFEESVCELK
ncbi:hypothetical protein Sjap_013387 [Stephania japonica]|uniref:Uncharacterized protein n=1 Tax=Stephania japonica TaxID=461633 RepID=A0AAP0IYL4_9MAGN